MTGSRLSPAPRREPELVAVRADQGDAAVELVAAAALQLGQQRVGQRAAVGVGLRSPARSNDGA